MSLLSVICFVVLAIFEIYINILAKQKKLKDDFIEMKI